MENRRENSKRIAKNTIIMYFRMILMMLISIYTSRVILNALGVEDYGIYNVVGGLVSMFAIVSGSLGSSVNRFLTFEMGKGNQERLKRVFSSALTVQLLLSAIILILAETVGLWYVNNLLVVPDNRLTAANWCFQFSIITFIVSLLSLPYNSVIVAHERMSTFAYVSLFEASARLGISFLILKNPFDRLIYYGLLLMLLSIAIRFIYTFYCNKHFEEVHCKPSMDKEIVSKMFGFAGWNFFGASSRILRDYGGNLLLNFYFGPVVNAARGIATSVDSAVAQFRDNFLTALNPQITKSYASNDRDYMFTLIFTGSRLSVYLLLLLSIPILLNTPFILTIWLKTVPEHAVLFTQLILIYEIVETISYPLVTAMLATGDIKKYQIIVGGCQCMNIPAAWVLLHLGAMPEALVVVSIVVAFLCFAFRLSLLKTMIHLDVRKFLNKVFFRTIIVTVSGIAIPLILSISIETGWINLIIVTIVSLITMGASIYYIGCEKSERQFVQNKLRWVFNTKIRHDTDFR